MGGIDLPKSRGDREPGRYRAPALEKGLEVLELLAREQHPLNSVTISERLGRSPSELFRMIQVLEGNDYIEMAANGAGFVLTEKIFQLAMEQVPRRTILEVALPVMRELSASVGQSCHLSVRAGGDIVVVARMESSEQIGFTVRIGYRRPFVLTASGCTLYAFSKEAERLRWLTKLSSDIEEPVVEAFKVRAERALGHGFERQRSSFISGVTDISAPVMRGDNAAAALTIPFVSSTQLVSPIERTIVQLRSAAVAISASLQASDHRV